MACTLNDKSDGDAPLFDESQQVEHEVEDSAGNMVAHDRLLQSINQLDSKTAARSIIQRSEASGEVSEFHMATAEGAGVNVGELLSSLGDKARHAALRKEVNRASGHRKLPPPLQKPRAVQLQRAAGYEKVTKEVSRWESLVKQQRRAEHVSFPLEKPNLRTETAAERTAAFQPQTPLEQEIAALLGGSSSVVPPGEVLSEAERRALAAVSLDEALERRRTLAKHRALLTYQEAKQRRQNKIKSRKYHRVLKKERIKQHLRDFERLKVCDPQAALAKLQEVERDRAEERMSQKHRNTGKWARMMALKRQYDPAAREALAENIRISREKTQKSAQQPEADGAESSDDDLDAVDATVAPEPDNPWIAGEDALAAYSGEYTRFWAEQEAAKRRLREAEKAEEAAAETKQVEEERPAARATAERVAAMENGSEQSGEEGEEKTARVVIAKKKKGVKRKPGAGEEVKGNKKKGLKRNLKADVVSDSTGKKKKKTKVKKQAENIDDIFDKFELNKVKKTAKKLKTLTGDQGKTLKGERMSKKQPGKKTKSEKSREAVGSDDDTAPPDDSASNMDESVARRSTAEQLEALGAAEKEPAVAAVEELAAPERPPAPDVPQLDASRFLAMQPRQLLSLPPSAEGDEHAMEDDSARLTIAEAFADDDVVAEFREEKEATVEADRPKDVDMALPGWGDWGGKDIKVSARKKRRLMFRAPRAGPRKDHTLGHVILSEKRNQGLRAHQPSQLPHYVRSVAAFEAMVRAPVGRTWIPSAAHQKLTMPAVATKAGTVIPPMDEGALLRQGGRRRPV